MVLLIGNGMRDADMLLTTLSSHPAFLKADIHRHATAHAHRGTQCVTREGRLADLLALRAPRGLRLQRRATVA